MTTRGQFLRSSTPGQKPAAGTRQPGEMWLNFPDRQIGLIDTTKTAQPVIAVRFFSTSANYAAGDFVVQAGGIWVAKASVTAGAFNPTQWSELAYLTDIPAPYVLPTASPTVLGGVKIDNSSIIIAAGVISATPYVLPTASPSVLGGVKIDNSSITIASGVISATPPTPYILPVATTTVLGGVKADGATIKVAGDGTLSTAPPPTNPNRIINGDMMIDQRNGGASGTTAGYTIDRWAYTNSTAPTGRGTWQQVASAAGGPLIGMGFGYCLNFVSSGAYTPAAADNFSFFQAIEADMVTDLLWGTANAQPITLSFLVSSSLTGQFGGVIANAKTGTRVYPFSFNLPVASTWTKISITIPGDVAAGWTMNGNGLGLAVRFDLGSGANFRAPAGAWTAGDIRGATGDVNVVGTNGANFALTAVKLELGSVATPFNRQTMARSLLDCQRYYQFGQMYLAGYVSAAAQGFAYGVPAAVPLRVPGPWAVTIATNSSTNWTLASFNYNNQGNFNCSGSSVAAGLLNINVNFNTGTAAEL